MYYQVKLKYLTPKEGSDEMEKKQKGYLVEALSISEAEGKMLSWIPANFQDPVVIQCSESKIIEIRKTIGDCEEWWEAILGDENEKGKLKPFHVVINGSNHLSVLKELDKLYSMSEFIGIKKTNVIIDDSLIGAIASAPSE